MSFFSIFQHLLPQSLSWEITPVKQLRELFDGLTILGEESKQFTDDVFLDVFPQTTRELPAWESQFNLLNAENLTEQERRDRLDAAWSATGGQSPRYLQDLLQANGFDVYVHEWWDGADEQPRTVRNPNTYVSTNLDFLTEMNDTDTEMGEAVMEMGEVASKGYVLVNKIIVADPTYMVEMNDTDTEMGESFMDMGQFTGIEYVQRTYIVPTNPDVWPYFVYIGAETFPDFANIPIERRNEFETLLLRYMPGHLWIGVLVTYS